MFSRIIIRFILIFAFQGFLIAMIAIAFQAIVCYRQRHIRALRGIGTPPRGIIFQDADAAQWDSSLTNLLKFLANYCFYKFGFEVILK